MGDEFTDWAEIFRELCSAKKEYEDTFTGYYEPSTKDFVRWINVNYGITLFYDYDRPDVGLKPWFFISDPEKYLIFMLKFTHE